MLSVALEKALSEGDMTIGVCACMCVVREILEIHFLKKRQQRRIMISTKRMTRSCWFCCVRA
jgi:hypothetical protein